MKTLLLSSKTQKLGRAGFTLVELAVTFLVLGLILGIGVPSFRQFSERSRVDGAAQELIMDIHFARSLAVSRRQTYQIQFQNNQYQVIEMNSGTVMRTKILPNRVNLVASGNPRFRSWGRADPVNITVSGKYNSRNLALLVTGNIRRL